MTSERGATNPETGSGLGDAVESEVNSAELTGTPGRTSTSDTGTVAGGLRSSNIGTSTATTPGTANLSSSGSRDKERETGDHLKNTAGRLADRVGDTISDEADTRASAQFTRAGSMLDHVADAVDHAGEELRADEPQVADAAKMASGQIRNAASSLRNTDLDTLIANAEEFARRQPALYLGAALAIGLMASRFLKASPSRSSGYGYGRGNGMGYGSNYGRGGYGYRPASSSPFTSGVNRGYQSYGARPTTSTGQMPLEAPDDRA